jgi:pimeloyl-ACP methyl ester carboxylesterase
MSMADDVAGFIEEHNLKDTTLIGHSMSGFFHVQVSTWANGLLGEPKLQ